MAQMFKDEKAYPDNEARKNFVFLAYPYSPPIALEDYRAVTKQIEDELPVRLWFFLDELTTNELMRKVWRAILRSNVGVFDISGGNPNVALELGLALGIDKSCISLLHTGNDNPLGRADLGYSERIEYSSAATLKQGLLRVLRSKCQGLRDINTLSYELISDAFPFGRDELEKRLLQTVNLVFKKRKTTRDEVRKIFDNNDSLAGTVLNGLRAKGVLTPEGARRHAKWVFGPLWVVHDHEVSGE
jgi:hypothetical protein